MEIHAKTRTIKGRKVKSLRSQGIIPAVIYSGKSSIGKKEVVDIEVDAKIFQKVYAEAGETSIIKIIVDEKTNFNVLVHETQLDPMNYSILHIGFFEVDLTQTIDTNVPVEIINEELNELVKSGDAILIKVLDEILVRSLPNDIPSQFEIDATTLKEVGDVATIKDSIKYDKTKVEILTDLEEVIVKLDFGEQLETADDIAADVGEVEVLTEKKPGEEGEAPEAESKEEAKDKDA